MEGIEPVEPVPPVGEGPSEPPTVAAPVVDVEMHPAEPAGDVYMTPA